MHYEYPEHIMESEQEKQKKSYTIPPICVVLQIWNHQSKSWSQAEVLTDGTGTPGHWKNPQEHWKYHFHGVS